MNFFTPKPLKVWILEVSIFVFFFGWSNFGSYKRNIGESVQTYTGPSEAILKRF